MQTNLIKFNTYKLERGGLLVDMYDQFNARVGDQGTPLVIQWTQGTTDTPVDLQKNKLHFYAAGQVGKYLEKLDDGTGYKMSADAASVEYDDKDSAGTQANGLTVAKLPKQFFPQEGIFYGYFGLKDDQGNTYTSVNVWFRVLGGVPIMGAAIPYFSTRFDELMETCQGRVEDALAQLRAEYQAEVQKNEDMSAETRAALSKLADAVGAIQAQIDAGNVVTMNRHIHDYDKLETDFTNANNKITEAKSQLAQLTKAPNVDSSSELADARIAAGSLGGDTYATTGQAIRAQVDDLATSMSQLGVYSKKFSVKANMSHSSTVDQLPVRIKKGESYSVKTVTTLSSPANLKLFEINSGDEYVAHNVGSTTDTTVNYVAKEDVTKLGWSIDPAKSDYDIYIIVTKSDSVLNKAEENQSDLTIIKGDAAFAKLSLLLSKDNEHSSNTDQVAVDLKEGDVYQVFFSSPADSEAVQVMEFGEDGEGDKALVIGSDGTTHSPNATTNGIFEYVAQKDVKKIGIYVAAPTMTGKLEVLIAKKGAARQQLAGLMAHVSGEQTVAAGNSLPSTKNGLYIPLDLNVPYSFTFTSDFPVNIQLWEYDLYDLSGCTKTLQFDGIEEGNQIAFASRKCNYIGVYISNLGQQDAHVKYDLAVEGSEKFASAAIKRLNGLTKSIQSDLIGNDLFSKAPVDDSKLSEYADLLRNASSNTEQFVFFTDPHPMHFGWTNELNQQTYLALQHYYNSTSTSFVLSGGDWLQAGQTPTQAAVTIGKINGLTKHLFANRFYTVLGNHDSNYQGIDDAGTPRKGALSQSALANLWFPKYHRCYYSFDGTNTKFYVLDSGSDWDTKMNDYRFEQVDWLAQQLIANNDAHSAIAVHIWWNDNEDTVPTPFAQTITQVIEAYNAHGSVTINSKSYDFSGKNGRVEFVLCGHLHIDRNSTAGGVPVVASLNATETTGYGFDLVLADYDKRSLNEIRVGSRGTNRLFSLDN